MRGITKLRLDRIKREREGARILMEMLANRFEVRVDHYDPVNEYIQTTTQDGGGEFIFFGAAAKRMEGYVKAAGLPPEEFLLKAASAYLAKKWTPEAIAKSRKLMRMLEMDRERSAGRLPLL